MYLDLVMLLNFAVDYLLLFASARLSGLEPGRKRLLSAAVLGAAYSGGCLVPGFEFLGGMLWRVLFLILLGMLAFGWRESAWRQTGVFLLLSLSLGGMAELAGKTGPGPLLLCAGLLWLACTLLLSSCRTRITAADHAVPSPLPASEGSERAVSDSTFSDTETRPTDEVEAEADTTENPQALHREYDENADAEAVNNAERLVQQEGEGQGAALSAEEAAKRDAQIQSDAAQTVTQTISAEEADRLGVSDEAPAADTATYYYTVLLQDRLRSLFECKRLYAYWETTEPYVTIFKDSEEHKMLLSAGAYDVAAKRMADDLTVDAGWVSRKSPDAIVKIVPASVLGDGILSTALAAQVRDELCRRPDWNSLPAVQQNRVFLLSESLLKSAPLRTAAMVYLAKVMYPALFEDVDVDEALRQLAAEDGLSISGAYVFLP